MKYSVARGVAQLKAKTNRAAIAVSAMLLTVAFSLPIGVASAVSPSPNTQCGQAHWALKGDSGIVYGNPPYNEMEVWLYAWVDNNNGFYCGEVYAVAKDYITACGTMKLVVQNVGGNWVPGSYVESYHCTTGTYWLTTPVVYPTHPGNVKGYNWYGLYNVQTPGYSF